MFSCCRMLHDDMAAAADVTAAGQAEQFPAVLLSVRMVFDILHTRIRVSEPALRMSQARRLILRDSRLQVHKDPKAVLKAEVLERSCEALVFERVSHGGKP